MTKPYQKDLNGWMEKTAESFCCNSLNYSLCNSKSNSTSCVVVSLIQIHIHDLKGSRFLISVFSTTVIGHCFTDGKHMMLRLKPGVMDNVGAQPFS